MTSTNIYVGLAEGSKSSIKVPNAPKGCISEIFGGEVAANGKSGAGSGPDTPSRPRDTHSRLFGAGTPRAALRNPSPSEDAIDNGHSNGHSNGHANGLANGHHSNGHVAGAAKEGNPITGDGYKSMNGEINTSVTALNGNAAPINHNRVPPGGYSSGLW